MTFANGATLTKVIIDTNGISAGDYTLVLESYDLKSNGAVPPTLKTDTISIIVEEPLNPLYFTEDLETEYLVADQPSKWTLPPIETGLLRLQEVRIDADPLISDQISFDFLSSTISFSGEGLDSLTSTEFVKIKITLVTSLDEKSISQNVIIYPSTD